MDTIFVGNDRARNRRLRQICGHYLVDPVACSLASSWKKGQVENQLGVLRRRFSVPPPKFRFHADPNAWFDHRCSADAKTNKHPDVPHSTIREVFEAEHPNLVPYVESFDGLHSVPTSVFKICL